ncbi:elongation factor P [Periweissella ghanensis]|uniref:Elongation factor P n=1 Tax=Periweissella ghanensis TaxID=467997 RepID=A0ABM8ZAL7_9LACO|nr:elongation factor P [Periweissella ghanensis]MCM0600712.1 elongation factor P [Periweissella ghanensis]CAH0418527.1 Elongation factor P [Periweissella ghanensis]
MAITPNDLKTGLTIEYNNAIWRVLEFQHVKPGKGSAFVRSKLKNLRTGAVNEITFSNTSEKLVPAEILTQKATYLYAEGDQHVFMNVETYDQFNLNEENIKDALKFMLEGMEVSVTTFGNEVLGVEVPKVVTLEVKETQPAIKGATANGGGKPATMETGLVIQVPDFINAGDKLVINTDDNGTYKSRA